MYFQEFATNVTTTDTLHMDMFDIDYSLLSHPHNIFTDIQGENFSLAGFEIVMKRSPSPYFINVYVPSALLTVTSFIGFLFPIGMEEGRRTAWLVTIFLMLVNISSTERNRGPLVLTVLIHVMKT